MKDSTADIADGLLPAVRSFSLRLAAGGEAVRVVRVPVVSWGAVIHGSQAGCAGSGLGRGPHGCTRAALFQVPVCPGGRFHNAGSLA